MDQAHIRALVSGISYFEEWVKGLKDAGVAISVDGKGRWIDNVFIERLWRSVKCEEV
jgi:transposase InsO family protein